MIRIIASNALCSGCAGSETWYIQHLHVQVTTAQFVYSCLWCVDAGYDVGRTMFFSIMIAWQVAIGGKHKSLQIN
jgi:hypothetical protein